MQNDSSASRPKRYFRSGHAWRPRAAAIPEVNDLIEAHRGELDQRFPWPAVRAWGVRNARREDGTLDYELAVVAGSGGHTLRGVPIEFVPAGAFSNPGDTDQ
jgi:hypothetical protein